MADHVAIAGLLADLSGAALLARGLAFEGAQEYVRNAGTTKWAGAGGTDVYRDFERAADGAEARVGAMLLVGGFVGQAIGAAQSKWSTCAAAIAYVIAVAVIAAGCAAMPLVRRRRERDIFLAHLHAAAGPAGAAAKERFDIYCLYLSAFTQTARSPDRLKRWVAMWEARQGRHPWHPELGPNPQG
jgi:hypothetical protein